MRIGREAEGEVVFGWKEPTAATVRERPERRGREEKRWKVLENRMVVVVGGLGGGDEGADEGIGRGRKSSRT